MNGGSDKYSAPTIFFSFLFFSSNYASKYGPDFRAEFGHAYTQNPSPQSTPGFTGRNSESELPGFDEQKLWLVMREGRALKSKLLADQMNFDHDAKEIRRVLTGRLASSFSSLVIIIMVEPL